METYLKDPMQDIPEMKTMQNMYPMMSSMYGMPQMMNMQYMYQMMYMQSMYQIVNMQNMYKMMNMQGMQPMMGMQGMNVIQPMTNKNDESQLPIPMLAKVEQLSANQIQISYDIDVDVRLGMKTTNYWIKDTMNVIPQGIATLGMNDTVNSTNSLTSNMVKIEQKNGSARTFILTFNKAVPRGAQYMMIICYVTVKGAPPYSGDNGMLTFVGK